MFSSVGTEMVEYQKLLGVLWWDRPPTTLLVLTLAFKTFFFVMTSVILMNMLARGHICARCHLDDR